MFGYIGINKPELKIKEYDEYRSTYCGLCQSLGKNSGILSQLTLTYDMTFLGILLTGLYEEPTEYSMRRCPIHPMHKVRKSSNRYIDYAADMNVLLACYNAQDDWLDDHSAKGLAFYHGLRKRCREIEERYPRQCKAVSDYLEELHACEGSGSADLDLASGLTGRMLAEIFVMEEDEWSADLRAMGFFLGKFIYLMDAFEDYSEDKESGSYNPWVSSYPQDLPENDVLTILTMMMAETTKAFERMPILENGDLLRNILYSGVWGRYDTVRKKLHGEPVPKEKRCHREESGGHTYV